MSHMAAWVEYSGVTGDFKVDGALLVDHLAVGR